MSDSPPTIRRVAVPPISFAQIPELVAELRRSFPDHKVNTECHPYHLSEDETIEYLRGYDAAIISLEPITARVLRALPELKVISKQGVGLDNIDPQAMREHGVRLGWTPGVNRRSVAELTIGLMIMALRHILPANLAMREGAYAAPQVGHLLSDRVVGILGCGEIGRDVVRLLQPFGCNVIAHDVISQEEFYRSMRITHVDLDTLLAESQVLSIHAPLNSQTHHLFDRDAFASLRNDCVLINTARGGIIDEAALYEALRDEQIAAAACDVFCHETDIDPRLLHHPQFIATPHLGSGAYEARLAMGRAALRGLQENFLPDPQQPPFHQHSTEHNPKRGNDHP